VTDERIFGAAAKVGKDAAAKMNEEKKRFRPVILFFTTQGTVSIGKQLKASGHQPTRVGGRTCFILKTPLYRTYEQAYVYADWCAEVLTAGGLDICSGVVWEGTSFSFEAYKLLNGLSHSSAVLFAKKENRAST
jgi:hypothetical protein